MENALTKEEQDSAVWLTPSESSHHLEATIQRRLASENVQVEGLVVHRLPNGVCLEGFVDGPVSAAAVCRSLEELDEVGEVQNRLVTRRLPH